MTFNDIAIELNSECEFDIVVENDDLKNDPGLETSVIISLFSDRRIEDDEIPVGQIGKRGWWGDMFPEVESDKIGSRFWLLARGKILPDTTVKVERFAKEALNWLIEDGVASAVDVVATFDNNDFLKIQIDITRPFKIKTRFDFIWDGQELKRG